jgi:flagellar export protein FliJ
MRFQFQLEGLLRVRLLLERQARERFEESIMRLHALEHRLAEAAQWSRDTAAQGSSQKGVAAAELQFIEAVLRQAQEAIAQGERQKQVEERRAADLQTAYLDARRERKTVGTLRKNAFRQFLAEQSRRDQSALDDAFLAKLIHTRNTARPSSPEANPEADR